jgi:hypothetical protein
MPSDRPRDPSRREPRTTEESDALDAELLAALRGELPPPEPPHLVSSVLQRVHDQLTLRDAVDLLTAGFTRVMLGGWLPRARSRSTSATEPRSDRED